MTQKTKILKHNMRTTYACVHRSEQKSTEIITRKKIEIEEVVLDN